MKSILIIAEQITILDGAERKVAQELTEESWNQYMKEQKELLGKWGFQIDSYGEKAAMIKRLTTYKAAS